MARRHLLPVALGLTVAAGVVWPGVAAGDLPVRGLDHVVVVVADLEAAAARYRALGFTLKPGRAHANGIRNQHVKFPDGTEIELLTVTAARDGLTARYLGHLQAGDGPVYAGFFGDDLEVVAGHLTAADWPLRRSGGLLTIDEDSLAHVFFGRRNRSPSDRPEHFRHANGAERLAGVWWSGDDTAAAVRLLADLGARPEAGRWSAPFVADGQVARLPEAEVRLLPAACRVRPERPICGVTIRVADVQRTRAALVAGGVPAADIVAATDGSAVSVAPDAAHGLWLEFRAE